MTRRYWPWQVLVVVGMTMVVLPAMTIGAAFGWRALVATSIAALGGVVWASALGIIANRESSERAHSDANTGTETRRLGAKSVEP